MLKQILDNILDDYEIKDLELDKKSGKLDMYLKSKEFISYDQIDLINAEIPLNSTIYVLLEEEYLEEEKFKELVWPFIVHTYIEDRSLQIMLLKARIVFDEKIYIMIADEFTINNMKDRRMDVYIKDMLSKLFSKPVEIEFEFDIDHIDFVKMEFEKRKQEEEQMRLKEISTTNAAPIIKEEKPAKKTNPRSIFNKKINEQNITAISEIFDEGSIVVIKGECFLIETRLLKGGKTLLTFAISDGKDSVGVKRFLNPSEVEDIKENLKEGKNYLVEGNVRFDMYEKELVLFAAKINPLPDKKGRMDSSMEKRVELNLHTNMTALDGISSAKSIIKTAISWGHQAIGITDKSVVQAYPEAMNTAGDDIKVLYGVEGLIADNEEPLVLHANEKDLNQPFIVFDIETTGFSPEHDRIIEIGAVKVENGMIQETFSELINPEMNISPKIVELTGITNDMVKDKPTIDIVLPKFIEFINDAALVAHNAIFDVPFIKNKQKKLGIDKDYTVLDTLTMSRLLLKDIKRFNLKRISRYLNVSLENHHRAVDDATATAHIFVKLLDMLKKEEIKSLVELNEYSKEHMPMDRYRSFTASIYAKNLDGLKTLYQLISKSHTEYLGSEPLIPISLLKESRDNLLIGSSSNKGALYPKVYRYREDKELMEIASFYDYLEIQPIENHEYLIGNEGIRDKEELQSFNKKIVKLGKRLSIPVVATGDVYFLNPEDDIYRKIVLADKHYAKNEDRPSLYLKTTDEMLQCFSYLGEDAHRVVVENTNFIADQCEKILPIPDGTFAPIIEGSDEELRTMCNKKAISIYGDPLPEYVKNRLDKELNSIISNGYSVMYIIAQKLVTKSLKDGYLVGSRGSVGSSFAATMSDITEVNPLAPHYICDKCQKSEFFLDTDLGSGVDLPDKDCPNCNIPYRKEGQDIPFEVFLGFHGDKEPDIDLNFAGVYQGVAHKYCEVLFGEGKTFKAGTIGTIAEKTAYGYVKKYLELNDIEVNKREILRLAKGLTGVKRTTGQHPGGIMVIPDYKDVEDFSPIQYPANLESSGVKTLHFDYHSISGRILKLDILGHDTPTIIKQLEELTGVDVQNIPLDDEATTKIFTTTESLNIIDENYTEKIGSLAVPEFGTKFVRQMLEDTQPTTFSELVRISGLSHGTDVWLNNAQDLVREGVTELKHVISTRDDIMNYLIYMDLPHGTAFKIMEDVRKGKGLKEEYVDLMRAKNVPEWYIESCNKIKYMFPKAHAAAYVMMSYRIAYFKVHYPKAFYATFFNAKVDVFDADLFSKDIEYIRIYMQEFRDVEKHSKKEEDKYAISEVVNEFYSRGFKIHKVDLYESDSDVFIIKEDGLLPPLRALEGVGENAARAIVNIRDKSEIISKEDLRKRAKVTKTVIESLDKHGCLEGLSETNQLSLFDFA